MHIVSSPPNLPKAAACLSFDDTIVRLTRAFQISRGVVRLMGGWIAGVNYWDAKLALGDHLWAHAQTAADLLRRLQELKETAAERQEYVALEGLLRDVASVESGDDFLGGCHGTLLPRLHKLFSDGLSRSTR